MTTQKDSATATNATVAADTKAATASTPKGNATAKPTAKKPAAKRPAAKRTAPEKAEQAVRIRAYGIPAGYGYPGMAKGGDHTITRAVTIAAAMVAGLLTVSPKTGLVGKGKAGDFDFFAKITAGKVGRIWTKALFESGEAVVKASGAMKGNAAAGYNAEAERVHAIAALILKGGKQSLKGKNGNVEVVFTKPIEG